ncbi:hypothetical protein [Kribbella sp. VKM Ac-2568]|uniref:hypothetical protein n=1 Tax=Kribbella sp. VKM Ac-2568 TaxID=2512219 RepID=UPI00105094DF|nr:hypothetical protein [Kribbella sp. VKM Ac-2568]TCM35972.1 hypothetical protein EV648_12320 [Kribbella sp. VKM Ac-2568]
MSTEGSQEGSNSAPSGGGGCKDPTDAYIALQCFVAQDSVVSEHRKKALDDMKTRTTAVKGIQVTYEDALAAQKSGLEQLLQDLKAIKKTLECQVTDRRDDLIRCFCKKVTQESGGASPITMPDNPCPKAERRNPADLEELRTAQDAVTSAIEAHKSRLDDLTGLPNGLKATVEQLAAKVKDLNTKICDKTIDAERAFVMQLHYRRAYVELRRKLTDPSTFVCRIYDLLDELFRLYAWDVCVAGAITWLEKKKQLDDERSKGQDAEGAFIDDVLRCSKPKKPPKPPNDDTDDVDQLDPCRSVGQGGQKPDTQPTEQGTDGGGGKGEPAPTGQYPQAEQTTQQAPTEQPPQTQQAPTAQETQPPSDGPATAQS